MNSFIIYYYNIIFYSIFIQTIFDFLLYDTKYKYIKIFGGLT